MRQPRLFIYYAVKIFRTQVDEELSLRSNTDEYLQNNAGTEKLFHFFTCF